MIEIRSPKDINRLRRIALAAQGLTLRRPFGSGLPGAHRAIAHLGYVQIDTISVVERAHHHVLHTRVPGFTPDMTHRLLLNRDIFEYWSHAAAFLPMVDYRFSLPYKHAIKSGKTHWFKTRDARLMRQLLERIRIDGPLRSRDLESRGERRAGWWDWKPAKQALEQLYMQGDLMVSDRQGFQKTYDLTERVLPSAVDTRRPDTTEFAEHLLDQQLRCHGLVSLKGLTYLRRDGALREAAKALVTQRLADRLLEAVRIPGGEVFFVRAGALEERQPRVKPRLLILSPFDNSVIQRDRLSALFAFDYQIECYLPEARRQYGYFCLPLLYRDTFVGRMDCKAHRGQRRLEIRSLFIDAGDTDPDEIVVALVEALGPFAAFQGCDSVALTDAWPRDIRARVTAYLQNGP